MRPQPWAKAEMRQGARGRRLPCCGVLRVTRVRAWEAARWALIDKQKTQKLGGVVVTTSMSGRFGISPRAVRRPAGRGRGPGRLALPSALPIWMDLHALRAVRPLSAILMVLAGHNNDVPQIKVRNPIHLYTSGHSSRPPPAPSHPCKIRTRRRLSSHVQQ